MSLETIGVILTAVSGFVSIGVFVGVTRTQTRVLEESIRKVEVRVDKCVTKSDFPAFFARERQSSQHLEDE